MILVCSWGYEKAVDGRTKAINGLAITGYNSNSSKINSYIQLAMSTTRSDITSVRLVAPIYQTLAVLPTNLSVYLSTGTNYDAGTLCNTTFAFNTWGEDTVILCPINVTARYVTVVDSVPNRRLAMGEVRPLYDGKPKKAWPA